MKDWTPLQRAEPVPRPPEKVAALIDAAESLGSTREEVQALIDDVPELWMNEHVVVRVYRNDDGTVNNLSIRHVDREPIHDWRMFQTIKNELAGEETEGVELYPAESRLVDTANSYWIFCFPPGQRLPLGFTRRLVSGPEDAAAVGAKQRAFD